MSAGLLPVEPITPDKEPGRDKAIPKLLTQNQMFDRQQADRRSEPTTELPPDVHQLVHQRLRTTMDILGREPKDQARPWTNCRVLAGGCMRLRITWLINFGALQRRAEVRTHENYREVFPLLSASFHDRSRGRCGPRERSPRSTKAPTKSSVSQTRPSTLRREKASPLSVILGQRQ
jgi:hypothetical protein